MHINVTCRELNLSKDIITKEILEKILKEGQNLLVITKDTILTPLAMDLINKENIKLDYQDDIILDNPESDFSKIKKATDDINNLPLELILKFYTLMLKIRLFEEVVKALKENKIIHGDFVHLYLGQEAIAVGVCSALTNKDFITSTHSHGFLS